MSQTEQTALPQTQYDNNNNTIDDDDDVRMNDASSSLTQKDIGSKKKGNKPAKTTSQRSSSSKPGENTTTKRRVIPSTLVRFVDEQSRNKKATSAYLANRRALDYISGVKANSLSKVRLRSNHLNPKKTNPTKKSPKPTRQTRQFRENCGKLSNTGSIDLLTDAAASLYIQNLIKNGYYPAVGITRNRNEGTKRAKLRFLRQHKRASASSNNDGMYDGSGKVNNASSGVRHSFSKTIKANHVGEAYVNGSSLFSQLSGHAMLSTYDLGIPFPTHTRSNLISNEKAKQK